MQVLLKSIDVNQKWIVRTLAVFLILAPVVNILLSFNGSGIEAWYEWNTFTSFMASVPLLDLMCLLSLMLSGIVLLAKKKFSLHLACLVIFVVSIFGVFRVFGTEVGPINQTYHIAYVIIGTLLNVFILGLLIFLSKQNKQPNQL